MAGPPRKSAEKLLTSATEAAAATPAPTAEKASEDADGDEDARLTETLAELTRRGVLEYRPSKHTVGFPLPPSPSNADNKAAPSSGSGLPPPPSRLVGKGLHGASEPAAKRRRKVLQWSLERIPQWTCRAESRSEGAVKSSATTTKGAKPRAERKAKKKRDTAANADSDDAGGAAAMRTRKRAAGQQTESQVVGEGEERQPHQDTDSGDVGDGEQKPSQQEENEEGDGAHGECHERRAAYRALDALLRGSNYSLDETQNGSMDDCSDPTIGEHSPKQWLPCQAAFAGSRPGRDARYGTLSREALTEIPPEVLRLFDLDVVGSGGPPAERSTRRRLFLHQARAIESAMHNVHTVVQTATGSGKSLCFLLPVLAKVARSLPTRGSAAILIFPTKVGDFIVVLRCGDVEPCHYLLTYLGTASLFALGTRSRSILQNQRVASVAICRPYFVLLLDTSRRHRRRHPSPTARRHRHRLSNHSHESRHPPRRHLAQLEEKGGLPPLAVESFHGGC